MLMHILTNAICDHWLYPESKKQRPRYKGHFGDEAGTLTITVS